MREITIYNPAAGKGKTKEITAEGYRTKSQGDCRRFVREECLKDSDVHFTVYGGDGTLNEAVSGIMDAEAGNKAQITVMPFGSGNDTIKSIPEKNVEDQVVTVDLIKYNDKYGINMLNIGFDCNVVASASRFKNKWKVAGKLSYILGVITEFFKPFGEDFNVEAVCENGDIYKYNGSCLLCAVCNGEWCGGSFHNSPASNMSDGVIEMMLVKKMSRLKFINLIGKYKNGTLVKDEVLKKYGDYVTYLRVKNMKISGCKQICSDGEIENCTSADISIIPGAIQYRL